MIGHLSGTVLGHMRGSAVVEVGGIGYRVLVTADTLTALKVGATTSLWVHHAVRENSEELFGFLEKDDLIWFELLLTVSGIGPKSALTILNAIDTRALESAITSGDAPALAATPGIGKKTAEKVVLELRDKVGGGSGNEMGAGAGEVVEALTALGYSYKEAREAARAVSSDAVTIEEKIREAIRIASRA